MCTMMLHYLAYNANLGLWNESMHQLDKNITAHIWLPHTLTPFKFFPQRENGSIIITTEQEWNANDGKRFKSLRSHQQFFCELLKETITAIDRSQNENLSGKTSENYRSNHTAFTSQFVLSNTDDAHVDILTNFTQRKLALTLTANL